MRRIFDDVVLHKYVILWRSLRNQLLSSTLPYSYRINLDSVHFTYDNHLVTPDGTTVFKKPITEQWIHVELNLIQGELLRKGKVVSQNKD